MSPKNQLVTLKRISDESLFSLFYAKLDFALHKTCKYINAHALKFYFKK